MIVNVSIGVAIVLAYIKDVMSKKSSNRSGAVIDTNHKEQLAGTGSLYRMKYIPSKAEIFILIVHIA